MQFPENYNQKKFFKYDIKKFENSIKSIKKELTKKNIYFIKLGWNKIWNINQFAWSSATNYIKNKYYKDDKKIDYYYLVENANFIFYTENNTFWTQHDGLLYMQYNLNNSAKKEAFEIFKKNLKKSFIEEN
jgi:hypothetical protein